MNDPTWKELIGQLAVGLVIFLFAAGFWAYDKRRKKKERSSNDINKLKPGKIFLIRKLETAYSDDAEKHFAEWVKNRGGRLIHAQGGGQIAYFYERGKSQFSGFLNIPSELLPVRMVFYNEKGQAAVRIDEDWGFQLFVGPAKRSFKMRYQEQLAHLANAIQKQIG